MWGGGPGAFVWAPVWNQLSFLRRKKKKGRKKICLVSEQRNMSQVFEESHTVDVCQIWPLSVTPKQAVNTHTHPRAYAHRQTYTFDNKQTHELECPRTIRMQLCGLVVISCPFSLCHCALLPSSTQYSLQIIK